MDEELAAAGGDRHEAERAQCKLITDVSNWICS